MGVDSSSLLLSSLSAGQLASVERIKPSSQALRLREIGLCEGQELEVLCAGDPMICRVGSCRVGICAKLAAEVRVST